MKALNGTKVTGLLRKSCVVVAIMLAAAAEANMGYTLEGCRSTKIPAGWDLPGHDYICPDSAYVTGNLKTWAELDLVPHRVTIENKGIEEAAFTFTVGGDFLLTETGSTRGWDYISELVLDENLSNDICKDWAHAHQTELVVQDLLIAVPGVGGVYSTIYRQIEVAGGGPREGMYKAGGLPDGAVCVANYYSRLALGSHNYSGSSLQSNLWDETSGGEKRVQLPNILAIEPTKSMTATQGETHSWSIQKSGPATVDFGDTCGQSAPRSMPVDINITWTKNPAAKEGDVFIQTHISISNTSYRSLYTDINDTIYNGDDVVLDAFSCPPFLMGPNFSGVVCEHNLTVSESQAYGLYDIAGVGFTDPVVQDVQWPIVGTLQTTASASVQPGNVANDSAIITDGESIYSTDGNMSFSSDSFVPGSIGEYVGYVAGTKTKNDVNWTSYTQNGSGMVTFHKTVYIEQPTIATGTLSDTAKLNGSDGFYAEDSHDVALIADATVCLTIKKYLPDVLQGGESVDVNFTIAGTDYENNVTIGFAAGETYDTTTVCGLEPGTYSVTENAPSGFESVEPKTQQVAINLPDCAGDITFNNQLAGQPAVKVIKVTYPAEIQGVPQKGDWNVTLYKEVNSSWVVVNSILTDPNVVQNELVPEGQLEEGHYKIEEIMKNGWYQSGKNGDCNFTVNYPADLYHADYVCTFENTKYGKVIITKYTDPSGMPDYFHFAQDVNASYDLNLSDMNSHIFWNVYPGGYAATEDDPRPNYDLVDLNCSEYDAPNSTATTTSLNLRKATINVDPGETVECTYTNRARGMVEVLKYENNSTDYNTTWNFVLKGNGVNVGDSTPPALMDFDKTKLIPGLTYTICEVRIPVAWNNTWYIGGSPVSYYAQNNDGSNEDHCYDFQVEANQTVHFDVYNDMPPGGEPRTIGYWKNWTTCDGHGNQVATAEKNGGTAAGWYLLDDVLPLTIDGLTIESCEDGVAILNKTSLESDRKCAGDPLIGLAAQLLAAKANYAAGAEQCGNVTQAISDADALLSTAGFNGHTCTKGKDAKTYRNEANELAGILDSYNNYGCQ